MLGGLLAVATMAACDEAIEPSVVGVPTSAPNVLGVCMDALISGQLVANERWGIALSASNGHVTKVLWPFGFHGVYDGNILALVDEHGQLVAHVGDSIQGGGGSVGPDGDSDNAFLLCGSIKVVP